MRLPRSASSHHPVVGVEGGVGVLSSSSSSSSLSLTSVVVRDSSSEGASVNVESVDCVSIEDGPSLSDDIYLLILLHD